MSKIDNDGGWDEGQSGENTRERSKGFKIMWSSFFTRAYYDELVPKALQLSFRGALLELHMHRSRVRTKQLFPMGQIIQRLAQAIIPSQVKSSQVQVTNSSQIQSSKGMFVTEFWSLSLRARAVGYSRISKHLAVCLEVI